MITKYVKIKPVITLADEKKAIDFIVDYMFEGGEYTPWNKEAALIVAIVSYFIEGVEFEKDDVIYDCVMQDKNLHAHVNKFFYNVDKSDKKNDINFTYINTKNHVMEKLNEVEATAKTLGTSLSKNLDGTTLQRTIDKIDNLVKNSDGFASKSQLEKLKTLRDSYTNSDSGITKAVNYDNSKIISNIEQEINARKKLAEIQKELQTGTYSATEAGYKNTLSKYEGQTSESLTRARESLKQFKEIREDFQKSLKDIDNNNAQVQQNLKQMEIYRKKQAVLDVNSKSYQDYAEKIQTLKENTLELITDNESLQDSIYELRFKPLDDAIQKYSDLEDELKSFRDLLNDDAFLDKQGRITKDGLAQVALLQQSIGTAKQKIADYTTGLQKLKESYDNGVISLTEYNDKSKDYREGIQGSIADVKSYQDSLVDLYKNAMSTEVDYLDKIIEKRKSALQAKADYYSYDKSISKKSNDINAIKAQIMALEGVKYLLL